MGKTPIRHCMGCNGGFEKPTLIRLVRTDGKVELDPTGKAPGRGAYLCSNADCLTKVKKSRRFNRVFKCAVDETIYEAITVEIEKQTLL